MTDPYRAPVVEREQTHRHVVLIERGRALVIAVIIPNLATTLITFLALPRFASVMRTLLSVWLFYALYRGKLWARNVLVVLYGAAILFSFTSVNFAQITFEFWPLLALALPFIHLASIIILTAVPAVGHFLYFQRNGHPRNYHDDDDDAH